MNKTTSKILCILTALLLMTLCGCKTTIASKKESQSSTSSKVDSSLPDNSSVVATPRGDYYVKGKGDVFPMIERIVKAYKDKDKSSLTDEKERYIYDCAVKVIDSNIRDNMTDFDKAKTIHDYIILNAKYDTDHLNELVAENPASLSPYGFFKNGKAICLGYTLTYQLLCQMADVECIAIHAKANKGEEHGWNMIKLDDEWYHVDVTWDDPLPDEENRAIRDFFCVSDNFMKETGHEWEKSKYPSAPSNHPKSEAFQ